MKHYRDLFKKKTKTMNNKMAKNTNLSIESKKLSKEAEQEQNHRYGDQLEGWGKRGKWGKRCRELEA